MTLPAPARLGGLDAVPGPAPIAGAEWFVAQEPGAGLGWSFPAGTLNEGGFLTCDLLVDGHHLAVFELGLQEGEAGPKFTMIWSALNQCSARVRVNLPEVVTQNRWRFEREGAWLKPMCGGDRVELAKVDRMTLTVARKSDAPVRWCQTPVTISAVEPPRLKNLILPRGPLLDELGQSAIHDWPGKTRSVDEAVANLQTRYGGRNDRQWPEGWTKWGGWKSRTTIASGFFRHHHDGKRWWLVDPEGGLFWSAGMDCVRVDTDAAHGGLDAALAWLPPAGGEFAAARSARGSDQPMVNYLSANLIRAFGPSDWRTKWAELALAELRELGFNTVANWSDWTIARDAQFPYVRPLNLTITKVPMLFRDFPDVFHPEWETECANFATQLNATKDDPAFIGYFLMNEPTWGFSPLCPAEGMLQNAPAGCHARRQLAEWLRERHGNEETLAKHWAQPVTLAKVRDGGWGATFSPAARKDLETFSELMTERYFDGLTQACRTVDPKHMNLGIRYYTVPPWWAIKGMKAFDVFSVNGYDLVVRPELGDLSKKLAMPVMVGEWHFGALDAGLPASGIGHVRTQTDRGRAYRRYVEDAAAKPWCVGVHWFTLYDESALGRFDGENWNIGFFDVCHRPYEPLGNAARLAHERLYDIAAGLTPPTTDAPEYLPKLFL